MSTRFRKKPVVIEASQFLLGEPIPKGVCVGWSCENNESEPHVHTIHAGQIVILKDGDWIIPELDGVHFYPCKPDIFAATYEPA
jgi:hypothetical protein